MTDAERAVLQIVKQIYRDTGAPVSTRSVSVRYFMSESNTWRYLRKLTQKGAVQRIGKCCGYVPVD